jgi:hypothetical protein
MVEAAHENNSWDDSQSSLTDPSSLKIGTSLLSPTTADSLHWTWFPKSILNQVSGHDNQTTH